MILCGIDPGPRWTAAVIVGEDSRTVLDHHFAEPTMTPVGLNELVRRLNDWIEDWCVEYGAPAIFVEQANAPTPHKGIINPKPIMQTERIIGALCVGLRPIPVMVPPASFGKSPLVAYPEALRGRDRTGTGKSRWQHARAGYDVAVAGALIARLEAQTRSS